MKVLKPVALYFSLVLGADLAVKAVGAVLFAPLAGAAGAAMLALPYMLAAVAEAAALTIHRSPAMRVPATRLWVGLTAAGLLFLSEVAGATAASHGWDLGGILFAGDATSVFARNVALAAVAIAPWILDRPRPQAVPPQSRGAQHDRVLNDLRRRTLTASQSRRPVAPARAHFASPRRAGGRGRHGAVAGVRAHG